MTEGRRRFLRFLTFLPLMPFTLQRAGTAEARPAEVLKKEPSAYLLNLFSVAGFQYHAGPRLLRCIHVGERLELRPEPENPHDGFAVRIERRGAMIGYVPRSDNRHISRLLRQGARLDCLVVEVDRRAPPWNQVRVEVMLRG